MRHLLKPALAAVLACLIFTGCSDDPKGLYNPCSDASECNQELPGNGVVCEAGPSGGAPFCTVTCGKTVEQLKGASPVKLDDCIQGVHDGREYVCTTGCCYITSTTQTDATDDTYAVSGLCLPAAP